MAGEVFALKTATKVVRDPRVNPGGEGVVEMPGELLYIVSADGVTEDGAECLEAAWRWFIERGIWRYGEPGGRPVACLYERRDMGSDVVLLEMIDDVAYCTLHPSHFTAGSTRGLQVSAASSIKRGWRIYDNRRAMAAAG